MIIDRNTKPEEVKERMIQSLEKMNQRYTTEESKDNKCEVDSSKIRFGWK